MEKVSVRDTSLDTLTVYKWLDGFIMYCLVLSWLLFRLLLFMMLLLRCFYVKKKKKRPI